MPDVYHVSWPIRDSAEFGILTAENEADELLPVDPMRTSDHSQATEDPPAIADVFLLFRTTVETSPGNLPFAEPSSQTIGVDEVQTASNAQGRHTRKNLAGMGLGTGADAITPVEVGTGDDVGHRLVDINKRQEAQERQGVEGGVQEPCVLFTKLIPGKGSRVPVLQIRDNCCRDD